MNVQEANGISISQGGLTFQTMYIKGNWNK